MGGKEGSRGYLVQTVVALLESMSDIGWDTVTIEPDHASDKVDVLWISTSDRKAIQVKSSINQIGKAEAQAWAEKLRQSFAADTYALILVGPCSHSVAEMKAHKGVSIPCPKSLDLPGMLHQAAHLLDMFLLNQGLGQKSAYHRELMTGALISQLSLMSTEGKTLSRAALVGMLKQWITASTPLHECWQQVTFEIQRGLEHAVAGQRLGPSDVRACPPFSICHDIISELDRSSVYEIIGVPGCGKSITAWHVAKHFADRGFIVWRPHPLKESTDLLELLPVIARQLIVIDDAQQFGRNFSSRLAETAHAESKVLLVSTIESPLQVSLFCLTPGKCVDELMLTMMERKGELLPIVRSFDSDVGDGPRDVDLDHRLSYAARQKTPWDFFYVLRGGWKSARREFDSLAQFPNATVVLAVVAVGQVISCDAGVSREWLFRNSEALTIDMRDAQNAYERLIKLRLVLDGEAVRTKHIQYAYHILDEIFAEGNQADWDRMAAMCCDEIRAASWSLKGVVWLLSTIRSSEAFRHRGGARFSPIVSDLLERSVAEREDVEWAASCFVRVVSTFDISLDEVLKHKPVLHQWINHHSERAALACSEIVNYLINASRRDENTEGSEAARDFINEVDVSTISENANTVSVAGFYAFGSLLNRLSFYGPTWSGQFMCDLDWERLKAKALSAAADDAEAVDKVIGSICRIAECAQPNGGLRYLEDVIPYVVRAITVRPTRALNEMHDIFWSMLGYAPKFLRGGRSPELEQERIARRIIAQVPPQAFAEALATIRSRDMESLAHSFQMIHEIAPEFIGSISECIPEIRFLEATSDEWRLQSEELLNLVIFFARGQELQPARRWVDATKDVIEGELKPLLAAVSPETAVLFYKSGRGVLLVDVKRPRWDVTYWAIIGVVKCDEAVGCEILERNLARMVRALYRLLLCSLASLIKVFRVLYLVSPKLFADFVEQIDLESPEAVSTISQLQKSQPVERVRYLKLARVGCAVPGKVGQLAKALRDRLL